MRERGDFGNIDILGTLRDQNVYCIIRINNVKTRHYEADIKLLETLTKNSLVDAVMYSKPNGPEEIDLINKDLEMQKVFLFVVIETLLGYTQYSEILCPGKGVKWTAIGAEDLCADMNIERPVNFYSNPLLNHMATDVALHAKLKGISFWGNIWPYIHSSELLPNFTDEIVNDHMMGAIGKVLFHPYQIDIVNSIFDPEFRCEIQKYTIMGRLSVIAERSKKEGLSVALFNGRVVDMPELLRVQRWLQELSEQGVDENIFANVPEIEAFIKDTLREL